MCGQTKTGYDRNVVILFLMLLICFEQSFATQLGGLRDPLVGRDPRFEKPCAKWLWLPRNH